MADTGMLPPSIRINPFVHSSTCTYVVQDVLEDIHEKSPTLRSGLLSLNVQSLLLIDSVCIIF